MNGSMILNVLPLPGVPTTHGASAQNVYHWLLSRYIGDDEDIDAGLKTKAAYKSEIKAAEEE